MLSFLVLNQLSLLNIIWQIIERISMIYISSRKSKIATLTFHHFVKPRNIRLKNIIFTKKSYKR